MQNNFDQIRPVDHAFAPYHESSVQEPVYHCLPELSIRKVFPGVIYANTNFPEIIQNASIKGGNKLPS